ncbi:MAG TPA: hypothetical protein VFZ62_02405 [Candidatus Saccharimonadales bacterium]
MDLQGSLLLLLVVILIGTRLPSYFRRENMSKTDRVIFVIMIFGLLGIVWLALPGIGKLVQSILY